MPVVIIEGKHMRKAPGLRENIQQNINCMWLLWILQTSNEERLMITFTCVIRFSI